MRRKNFQGTNMGNNMGDIVLPSYALLWQLIMKQKFEVFGPKRMPVGGKAEGEEGVGRGHHSRTPQTVEPAIWDVKLTKPNPVHMFPNLVVVRFVSPRGEGETCH